MARRNATCLKLIDFDEVTGALTPDAATSLPAVSPDGKTYTFTIAPAQFQAGPGGRHRRELQARARARLVAGDGRDRPVRLPAREFVGAIVGAAAFFHGSAGSISGVQASGNTLSIELLAANPTFLYQLRCRTSARHRAMRRQDSSAGALASAGPCYVSSASTSGVPPNEQHEIVLQRNPNYGGSRVRNLGTIRWVQYVSPLAEDYVLRPRPPTARRPACPSYRPSPPASRSSPSTRAALRSMRSTAPRLPTRSAAQRSPRCSAGRRPINSSRRSCPATRTRTVYPLDGSGASTAVGLLGGATPSVTLCSNGPRVAVADLAEAQLEAVGFQVNRVNNPPSYFTYIANPSNCDLAMLNNSPDFPDASRILQALFYGGNSANFSFFNDPTFNARFAAAATMTPESARLAEYADLDAAWPTRLPRRDRPDLRRDAFADRIGCRYLSQALFGYALNRLCIEVEATATPGGATRVDRGRGDGGGAAAAEVAVPSGGAGGTVTITQGQSSEVVPARVHPARAAARHLGADADGRESARLHVRARRLRARGPAGAHCGGHRRLPERRPAARLHGSGRDAQSVRGVAHEPDGRRRRDRRADVRREHLGIRRALRRLRRFPPAVKNPPGVNHQKAERVTAAEVPSRRKRGAGRARRRQPELRRGELQHLRPHGAEHAR